MSEREEFFHVFRSAFIKMVERLDTMTESQVLEGIQAVKAARDMYKAAPSERFVPIVQAGSRERPRAARAGRDMREELADLGHLQVLFHSVQKLQSRPGPKARPLGSLPFDPLEVR